MKLHNLIKKRMNVKQVIRHLFRSVKHYKTDGLLLAVSVLILIPYVFAGYHHYNIKEEESGTYSFEGESITYILELRNKGSDQWEANLIITNTTSNGDTESEQLILEEKEDHVLNYSYSESSAYGGIEGEIYIFQHRLYMNDNMKSLVMEKTDTYFYYVSECTMLAAIMVLFLLGVIVVRRFVKKSKKKLKQVYLITYGILGLIAFFVQITTYDYSGSYHLTTSIEGVSSDGDNNYFEDTGFIESDSDGEKIYTEIALDVERIKDNTYRVFAYTQNMQQNIEVINGELKLVQGSKHDLKKTVGLVLRKELGGVPEDAYLKVSGTDLKFCLSNDEKSIAVTFDKSYAFPLDRLLQFGMFIPFVLLAATYLFTRKNTAGDVDEVSLLMGNYRVSALLYVSESMEYMRSYLQENMLSSQVQIQPDSLFMNQERLTDFEYKKVETKGYQIALSKNKGFDKFGYAMIIKGSNEHRYLVGKRKNMINLAYLETNQIQVLYRLEVEA